MPNAHHYHITKFMPYRLVLGSAGVPPACKRAGGTPALPGDDNTAGIAVVKKCANVCPSRYLGPNKGGRGGAHPRTKTDGGPPARNSDLLVRRHDADRCRIGAAWLSGSAADDRTGALPGGIVEVSHRSLRGCGADRGGGRARPRNPLHHPRQ